MFENLESEEKKSFFKIARLYFFISLFIQLDRIVLGKYALIKEHDTFDSFWPFQKAISERISSFNFPGWFPDYLGGMAFNNMDINWSSIPVLISSVFPDPFSFIIVMLVEFLICSIGTYYFLRYFFPKIKRNFAFFSGAVWALGITNLTYWRIVDLASIPLLLIATDMIFKKVSNRYRSFAILGCIICLLNIYFAKGAPFIAFFHLFFIYFSHNSSLEGQFTKKDMYKSYSAFVLFWGSCFLINLPVIVSLLTTNSDGMRSLVDFNIFNTSLLSYLKSSSYEFFRNPLWESTDALGAVGAFIFFFSLFGIRKGNKLEKSIVIFYFCALLYVKFVDPASWYQHIRTFLPLTEYRLSRLMMIGPFVALLIFSTRTEGFLEYINKESKKKILLLILISCVVIGVRNLAHPYPSSVFENVGMILGFSLLSLAVLFRKNKFKITLKVLFLIIMVERFTSFNLVKLAISRPPSYSHFFESSDFEKFIPDKREEFRVAFFNNHPTVGFWNKRQSAGGYVSQYPKRYAKFWMNLVKFEKKFVAYPYKAYLEDVSILKEQTKPLEVEELYFNHELLALNNIKYLYSRNRIIDSSKFGLKFVDEGTAFYRELGLKRFFQILKRNYSEIDYFIYEVENTHQRCRIVRNVQILANEGILNDKLAIDKRESLEKTVYFNRSDLSDESVDRLSSLSLPVESSPCLIKSYKDNQIVIDHDFNDDGLLVLNETYTDDWFVKVDGVEREILPAMGFLRSVYIGKGKRNVEFYYKPKYWMETYLISISVLLIYIILFTFFYFNRSDEVEVEST